MRNKKKPKGTKKNNKELNEELFFEPPGNARLQCADGVTFGIPCNKITECSDGLDERCSE